MYCTEGYCNPPPPCLDRRRAQGEIRVADPSLPTAQFSDVDHTTKMFMTERNEQLALFQPTYACNPDDDTVQIELRFVGRQNDPAGGWICVRPTFDNAHEFRYYPPGDERK